MVEEPIQVIGQALAAMGARYPFLTIQWELYSRLCFQFRCYIKQYLPLSLVNPTLLQALCHISIISNSLGYPILQSKCNMVMVAYFFLVNLGEYTGSKLHSSTAAASSWQPPHKLIFKPQHP